MIILGMIGDQKLYPTHWHAVSQMPQLAKLQETDIL